MISLSNLFEGLLTGFEYNYDPSDESPTKDIF